MNLLERLDLTRGSSSDRWIARCPAHEDRKPSLSVSKVNGRFLVHCHAGCDTRDVLKAVGLQWSDLFDEQLDAQEQPIDEYEYRDEKGELKYVVERLLGKRFRQRRQTPAGDWVWNMDGVERLLYRLPKITEAVKNRWILLVEGEKDVHTLEGRGFAATTVSGGASAWRHEQAARLAGAKVVIIPDNDEPGRAFAEKARTDLCHHTVQCVVLNLPGLPHKGDVSDWFSQGHTADELKALITSQPQQEQTLCRLSDVKERSLEWLWSGRIPRKKLCVIGGDPGQGKSYLSLLVLSALSRGEGLPGIDQPEDSLLITWEDDPHDTVKPRCAQLGADLERIHVWDANLNPFSLPGDLPRLKGYLKANPEITTLVVDPLVSCMGASDIYRDDAVRARLGELCSLDLTVIGIMHLVKASPDDERSALNRLLGSRAFTARARSVLLVQNSAVRVIKSNVSEVGVTQHFVVDSGGFRLMSR